MHAKAANRRAWLRQVEETCAQKGLLLTPLRRQVTQILAEARAPLGAYAILEELSKAQSKSLAPPAVYRTLDFLVENGFVLKIASRNAYAPCHHIGHDHHGVLLICTRCGRMEEIESPEIDVALNLTAERVGFRPNRQVVEVEGRCAQCLIGRG